VERTVEASAALQGKSQGIENSTQMSHWTFRGFIRLCFHNLDPRFACTPEASSYVLRTAGPHEKVNVTLPAREVSLALGSFYYAGGHESAAAS